MFRMYYRFDTPLEENFKQMVFNQFGKLGAIDRPRNVPGYSRLLLR